MASASSTPRPPALVLGSGNTALGAIRALGRRGIPLYVGSPVRRYEAASRWYRPVPGRWDAPTLAANLGRCGLERAVVIPTSDEDALAAATLPAGLRARFPSATARPELIRALTDKALFAELLARFDTPRPRTWRLDSLDALDTLDDETLDAGFLKPRDSLAFLRVFNRKSMRPRSRASTRQVLEELVRSGFEMVLQEYVPGPPTHCYLLDGFIDREGRVRGLFARQRLRQFPSDFGNSTAVRSVAREEVRDAEEALLDVLGGIGYRGVFNAEFKRDARDGSFRLFEINPRVWWYVEFAQRCGIDTVTMSYRDALGEPVETAPAYDVGRTVIFPYFDVAACRARISVGEMSLLDAVRSWKSSEQLIYAPDDPRPGFADAWQLASGWIGRRLPGARATD